MSTLDSLPPDIYSYMLSNEYLDIDDVKQLRLVNKWISGVLDHVVCFVLDGIDFSMRRCMMIMSEELGGIKIDINEIKSWTEQCVEIIVNGLKRLASIEPEISVESCLAKAVEKLKDMSEGEQPRYFDILTKPSIGIRLRKVNSYPLDLPNLHHVDLSSLEENEVLETLKSVPKNITSIKVKDEILTEKVFDQLPSFLVKLHLCQYRYSQPHEVKLPPNLKCLEVSMISTDYLFRIKFGTHDLKSISRETFWRLFMTFNIV